MPYVGNIENETQSNENFRKVIFTGPHMQLVLMSLQPSEDIGMEVHPDIDQFIRVESGQGKAILDGVEFSLTDGVAVVIPAGTNHNIINTSSDTQMKLYTIYTPVEHAEGTVHRTKQEALSAHHDH